MNIFIFDTSFLISILDIDDINHKKAIDIISDLEIWEKENKFYINDVILNETYTVLNYKKWFEYLTKCDSFIEQILTINLSSNNQEYIAFFKLILWKVSVADSSVFYDSLKYNFEILSFDKEMLKIKEKFNI